MNTIHRATLALATVILTACGGMYGMETASSGMSAAPAMARDGVLTNSAGMTLYVFDRDPADASKSVCNGPCAINWPPLMASGGTSASGDWAMVTRDDRSKQWAYKGKPLYLWVKDTKPGDRTGDGVNDVWHVARP